MVESLPPVVVGVVGMAWRRVGRGATVVQAHQRHEWNPHLSGVIADMMGNGLITKKHHELLVGCALRHPVLFLRGRNPEF